MKNHMAKKVSWNLARKTAKNGVHYKTPVFDGADYDADIKPLLQDLTLPEAGAFKIA